MHGIQRIHPLNLVATAAVGAALGYTLEFAFSTRGRPPFVPPYSMSIALVLLATLLVGMGLRLRRNRAKGTGAVNPFQAVRLLATARAGEIVGSLFFGFGAGLLLSLVGRSVPAPAATWLPMLVTSVAGLLLLIGALIAEHFCKVPPGDDGAEQGDEEPRPGTSDQPAFRDAHETQRH